MDGDFPGHYAFVRPSIPKDALTSARRDAAALGGRDELFERTRQTYGQLSGVLDRISERQDPEEQAARVVPERESHVDPTIGRSGQVHFLYDGGSELPWRTESPEVSDHDIGVELDPSIARTAPCSLTAPHQGARQHRRYALEPVRSQFPAREFEARLRLGGDSADPLEALPRIGNVGGERCGQAGDTVAVGPWSGTWFLYTDGDKRQ